MTALLCRSGTATPLTATGFTSHFMHHASSRSVCPPEPVRRVVRPARGVVLPQLGLLPLFALLSLPAVGQSALAPLPDGHAFDSGPATLLLALYFGMLLGLIGYNLLLFLALRERTFLLYVLFAASFAGAMLGVSGLGNQYLWPPGGAWDTHALPIFITLANICALLFGRSFLDTARQAPRWDLLLSLDIAILLAIAFGSPLLPVKPLLHALALVSAGNLLLLSLCGFDGMLRRAPAARIFLAAWLLLQGGALLLALRIAGLLPSNTFTVNTLLLGSALQMLLLSFALAARLNALKREKSTAQAHSLQALQEQEQILEQRVAERTEALAAANERLRELAMRDPLTGLANRMALRQHLEQAWQRARRRNELLALIMLDLDGFKPVNDCHGHEVGDQLLVEVARRLQASARTTDLVARLGGDEFVLVCESIGSPQQAQALAGRILDALSQPFRLGAQSIRIGASIGISFGQDCGTGNDLLREADQAMYRAKAAGRNRMHMGRQHPEDQLQGEPTPPDEL